MLVRCGLLIADPVHPYLNLGSASSLDHLQAASIRYRFAIGPHTGHKALTLYSLRPAEENSDIPLLAGSGYQRLSAQALNERSFPPGTAHALLVGTEGGFRPKAPREPGEVHLQTDIWRTLV